MGTFAGSVKSLDMKLQYPVEQEEVAVEDVLKSSKIATGKASGAIWENLTAKVWNRLSNIEKQAFASDVTGRENRPKTLRDFHVFLMAYFLENHADKGSFNGNTLINNAVNS
jgi:hypothetical protein